MDPTKPLHAPAAEISYLEQHTDQYGETWSVIDGIETKVPTAAPSKRHSLIPAAAQSLLDYQDAKRAAYRAMLDAEGVRDQTERVVMEDGTTRDLLPGSVAAKWLFTPEQLAAIEDAYRMPPLRPGRVIPVEGDPSQTLPFVPTPEKKPTLGARLRVWFHRLTRR